jgi:uncharacterized protein (TIGR03000 family)
MSHAVTRVGAMGMSLLVLLVAVRPIMSQPIGPRGAPLFSPPGFIGPGPTCGKAAVTTGWSYYGLPNGPTTTVSDYRVGVWNWGWAGVPTRGTAVIAKALNLYGPPVPDYSPKPAVYGCDARRHLMEPPHFGYGLHSFGYRSAFPRLATPSVSSRPSPAPSSAACCRVDVKVPHADAELWVNQTKTAMTGSERVFESPELAEGKEFRYELVAKWTHNGAAKTDTRSVTVSGGKVVRVDFTEK